MSEQYIGQKMVENEQIHDFLKAYEEVTGEVLAIVDGGERPDFIAVRPSGEEIGIELTRPHHNYESAKWDRILGTIPKMNDFELMWAVNSIIEQKAAKLARGGWRMADNTILVVQLVDYSFLFPEQFFRERWAPDYESCGFSEIWLADRRFLDPFGTVQLIGLYPKNLWGLHHQPSLLRKPYG